MSRWESFCIVGIGGHARTKLIPAIVANGQEIAGLVSRQSPDVLPDFPVFATLDAALGALPASTAVVIASPPAAHYGQVCAAIDAGFDVIVEKPAFLHAAEAQSVADKCAAGGTVVVEAFMQRHTGLYRRLLDFCMGNRVSRLELAFTIPAMPDGTFRNPSDPGGSSLYDIGCYILALLADLRLDPAGLEIVEVRKPGTMAEAVDLAGTLGAIAVTASIGVSATYCNRATVWLEDGSETTFQPVFYGRPGPRTIGSETIEDGNAFEAMFAIPREQWLRDQASRSAAIIAVTERLEALSAQLAQLRGGLR